MPGKLSDPVRGKTVRLSWTSGPARGAVHEHMFHDDGTVEWRTVSDDGPPDRKGGGLATKATEPPERPSYAAVSITYDVCLISYLASSGFTLTVALNFNDGSTTGFASNDKTWMAVKGRFEVMHRDFAARSAGVTSGVRHRVPH